MSDEQSQRPKDEDENSENAEPDEAVSNEASREEPELDRKKEPEPEPDDEGPDPELDEGEREPKPQDAGEPAPADKTEDSFEKFDESLDAEYDRAASDHDDYDDYEHDDEYGDMYDYGFSDPDAPREPRSAAGRFLNRRREEKEKEEGDEDDEEYEDEGMSFLEHLEEFRWTLARSIIAFIVGVVVVLVFHKWIADFIQYPLNRAYGSAEVAARNLITYRAMGVISVFIQIALIGGLTLSMPFVLYFMGNFVAPGLTAKERMVLRPACYAAFLLFLTGVSFGFFVILPLALAFTVRLNEHLGFDILWAASDYYNMVVYFSLAIGFFFQFPLIVVILVYLGVLSTEMLKRVRRGVFVGLLVFSALISPGGDPISLLVSTGFMYGLYEGAILVGKRIERKRSEIAAALEDD